jgi:triosephosphate isomerase
MRKYYLFGNWKMNKTIKDAVEYANCVKGKVDGSVEFGIFPPFTAINAFAEAVSGANISVGAQNMYFEEKGAFTGEVSPIMLKELGVKYVLIGHSERRHIFNEDNDLINKKVLSALSHGLVPVLCVGETSEERQNGKTEQIVKEQLEIGLKGVTTTEVIIAYEPVWAIGTGVNATVEQASAVHKFIRAELNKLFGNEAGETVSILYGGSIKESNFEELASNNEIDGGLVGGASLECDSFLTLYNILKKVKLS